MKNIVRLLPILFLCVCCEKESHEEEPLKYTLHVSVVPLGSGIVSPLGGYFEEGTSIEITIEPKDGYIFNEYSGDVTGTSVPIIVEMNSDKMITVAFEGVDFDEDGVIDIVDKCPNTAIGEEVNDIGCSVSQKYYVPDENFEKKLIELGYDNILDGYVPEEQIGNIEELNISGLNISDLTGIENFINLRILDCSGNLLTSLDLSNNTSLTNLNCSGNPLSSLDLSNNTSLTGLNCSRNALTSLDLSNNPNIETLNCRRSRLSSLDLSNKASLVYVECSDNGIRSLDVSNSVSLTTLECARNGMTSINLTNATNLTDLYCYANKLSSLNVGTNTSLKVLSCNINELSSLDVSKNVSLVNLGCTFNQLSSLDVSKNASLLVLSCDYNDQLSCIKVHQSQLDNIPSDWSKGENAFWSVDCN